MRIEDDAVDLTALADGTLAGPEWDAWLAAHPEAAAEVAIARRVRAIVTQLQYADIVLPPHFEARVMERVRSNSALLDLLELSLANVGHVLLEILAFLFGGLPEPRSSA
jgi:hypothetical protein